MFKTLIALAALALPLSAQTPNPNLIFGGGWSIDNNEPAASLSVTPTTITFKPTITSGSPRTISFSQQVLLGASARHQFAARVDVPSNATPGPLRGWSTSSGLQVMAPANILFESKEGTMGGSVTVTFSAPSTTDPNVVYTIEQPRLELSQPGPAVIVSIAARPFANSTISISATSPSYLVGSVRIAPVTIPGLGWALEVDLTQPYVLATGPVNTIAAWGTLGPLVLQAVDLTAFGTTVETPAF